jgi:hypothetical protein
MYVYNVTMGARSCYHCCSGRAVSITHSECLFAALGIQHAVRMRHLWLPRLYRIFLHYLINGKIFEKKKDIEYKMCVFLFHVQSFCDTSLILRINKEYMIKMYEYIDLRVKCSFFLSDFNGT